MLTVKYFSAGWCQPCKVLRPVVDRVASETGLTINHIDVDTSKDLVSQYNISSVPTLVFEKGGQVIHRHTGGMTYNQLLAVINRL